MPCCRPLTLGSGALLRPMTLAAVPLLRPLTLARYQLRLLTLGRGVYSRSMFFRGQTIGKYRILSALGQRWLRHRLPRRGHLDRQEGRAQGPPPAEHRLRRTAARAPPARRAQPPEHRLDPDRGEAGERLLHRHGVRAGRDARGHHRPRGRARAAARARLHLPDLQRGRPRARARASCTATSGRRNVLVVGAGPGEGRRLRHVALPGDRRRTARRSSAARPTWRPSSSTGRRCSPRTSTRSA